MSSPLLLSSFLPSGRVEKKEKKMGRYSGCRWRDIYNFHCSSTIRPLPPPLCFCAPLWGAGFPIHPCASPFSSLPSAIVWGRSGNPACALYHAHSCVGWTQRASHQSQHVGGGGEESCGARILSRLFCLLLCNEDLSFLLYSFGGFFFFQQDGSRVTWSSLGDQLMSDLVAGPHIFAALNTVQKKTTIIWKIAHLRVGKIYRGCLTVFCNA